MFRENPGNCFIIFKALEVLKMILALEVKVRGTGMSSNLILYKIRQLSISALYA